MSITKRYSLLFILYHWSRNICDFSRHCNSRILKLLSSSPGQASHFFSFAKILDDKWFHKSFYHQYPKAALIFPRPRQHPCSWPPRRATWPSLGFSWSEVPPSMLWIAQGGMHWSLPSLRGRSMNVWCPCMSLSLFIYLFILTILTFFGSWVACSLIW